MGKSKKAKKENGGLNIDATEVKDIFVELASSEGVVLTSTTPQMKDLGPDGFRYTMWGVNKNGNRCLVIMTADRDAINSKENWASKYPDMKTVAGKIVTEENQKFATKRILSLCANKKIAVTNSENSEARPIMIPSGTKVHYGYAMCAKKGQESGFVIMENGANSVQFSEVTPKFLETKNG